MCTAQNENLKNIKTYETTVKTAKNIAINIFPDCHAILQKNVC